MQVSLLWGAATLQGVMYDPATRQVYPVNLNLTLSNLVFSRVNGTNGLPGQVLTSTGSGVVWSNLPPGLGGGGGDISTAQFNAATLALSNLSYTIGENGTNFSLSLAAALSNLSYVIGENGTNYTDSRSVASSNLSYAIGTSLTNFVYAIGLNTSNYVDSRAIALSNLSYAIGASSTNYANAIAVAVSNLAYTIGENATNFTYLIGANNTNYVNSRAVALSNLAYVIGANGTSFVYTVGANITNYVDSRAVALSNLAYVIGANSTNFTYSIGANTTNFAYSIGANDTNYINSRAVALSNLSYAIGANATNFVYSIGANDTNYVNSRAVAASNLSYVIGLNATSFVYSVGANNTNYADSRSVAASNLSYAIGLASTNYSNLRVVGPASATANGFVRFDGTTGKLVKDSTYTLDDSGSATFSSVFVSDVDATEVSTDDLTVADIATINSLVAGAIKISITPDALVKTDGNTNLISVPNAAGMLTNNGAGIFGYMAIPSGSGPGGGAPAIGIFTNGTQVNTNAPVIAFSNTASIVFSGFSNANGAVITASVDFGAVQAFSAVLSNLASTGSNNVNYATLAFVNSATVALSNLSYVIGANDTNYTDSRSVAASNLSYAIGTASTNFAYSIGANDTNYINSRAVSLSNLSYAIGLNATSFVYSIGANNTNYTDSRSVAASNLAYAIGANSTNFTYAIGANNTNYTDSRSVAASNLSYAIGTASTNYANAKTNTPAISVGLIDLTNNMRIRGLPLASVAVTNLDFTISQRWGFTNGNGLNQNLTLNLTNFWDGLGMSVDIPANKLGTNFTVAINVSAGGLTTTNIEWRSPTNGNSTFVAQSNANYTVYFFCSSNQTMTNIVAWWSTSSGSPIPGLVSAVGVGGGPSNAVVGGQVYFDIASRTNHSTVGNYTNLSCFTNIAHSLTNNGDTITLEWAGVMLSGTNKFVVGYGSITNLLDLSGLTNGHPLASWYAILRVTRTGNTSQRIFVEWQTSPGFGIPFSYTNRTVDIAETNGIANFARLQGAAIRPGGITNTYLTVDYKPASR